MDADAGVAHLGCVYMKGDVAHCGFPERAYGKNVQKAVAAGLRVARVEQTETPEMMQARTGKKSGMVRREVCGIMSPGTRTLGVRDGYIGRAHASRGVQLLAVVEEEVAGAPVFGACIVDSTTGAFRVGQFADTSQRLGLRTLLEKEEPAEVAYFSRALSKPTMSVLAHDAPPHRTLHTKVPPSTAGSDWGALLASRADDYFGGASKRAWKFLGRSSARARARCSRCVWVLLGCPPARNDRS